MQTQEAVRLNEASPAEGDEWQVARVDIRSPVLPSAWPVARVELKHAVRGRVTDIGSAPGGIEATFAAASNIIGISGRVLRFDVRSAPHSTSQGLAIVIELQVEIEGRIYVGVSSGTDLIRCSLQAWLEALQRASRGETSICGVKSRPFQASGIDENEDLWIFASDDQGAVEAIAAEFRQEGYTDIQFRNWSAPAAKG